jgi:hypothetical protein
MYFVHIEHGAQAPWCPGYFTYNIMHISQNIHVPVEVAFSKEMTFNPLYLYHGMSFFIVKWKYLI